MAVVLQVGLNGIVQGMNPRPGCPESIDVPVYERWETWGGGMFGG